MNSFKKYDGNISFNIRFIGEKTIPRSSNYVRTLRNYTTRNIDANIYFRPDNKLGFKFVLLDLDKNPSKLLLNSIQKFGAFLIV